MYCSASEQTAEQLIQKTDIHAAPQLEH